MDTNNMIKLEPNLTKEETKNFHDFIRFIRTVKFTEFSLKNSNIIEDKKNQFLRELEFRTGKDANKVRATIQVITDLLKQGWRVQIDNNIVEIERPLILNGLKEKHRVRTQLHVERNQQLSIPSVRSFVKHMEQRRLHSGTWVSIFDLMRDGRELSESLIKCRKVTSSEEKKKALNQIINPYIEIISDDAVCSRSGFRLLDIWRYFRYTWANPHRSIPGRKMMVLVRDASVELHPIIGIGTLSSAAIQISSRDDGMIEWSPKAIIKKLTENSSIKYARWLQIIDRKQ